MTSIDLEIERDGTPDVVNRPPQLTPPSLLEMKNISRIFGRKPDLIERLYAKVSGAQGPKALKAVTDVSLRINKGEVVGLVGESGCGKSTLGRLAADLLAPTSGTVFSNGHDINELSPTARLATKLKTQMIFQNPFASLNPRMTVAQIVGESPRYHGISGTSFASHSDYVDQQLMRAGLDPSVKHRFPHQFSGGQRQRIGIARALAVQPELLICDESVAALDVSIQAQILNLFMDLRADLGLTYLFISHDLGVVRHTSDRVAVMYLGRIVETASAKEIFDNPSHPYTQALIAEVPRIATTKHKFSPIKGELPSPLNPPSGCAFNPRCPKATERCGVEVPALQKRKADHFAACHHPD